MTTSVPAAPAAEQSLRLSAFNIHLPKLEVIAAVPGGVTDDQLTELLDRYFADAVDRAALELNEYLQKTCGCWATQCDAPMGQQTIAFFMGSPIGAAMEILQGYASNKVLGENQIGTLKDAHQNALDLFGDDLILGSADQLGAAPADPCDAVDIPAGSSWVELIAAVLDIHYGTSRHMFVLAHASHEAGIALNCNKELR